MKQDQAKQRIAEIERRKVGGGYNIEAAAKVLSAGMDYPWEHIPEQGRQSMRKLAKDVIEAAGIHVEMKL